MREKKAASLEGSECANSGLQDPFTTGQNREICVQSATVNFTSQAAREHSIAQQLHKSSFRFRETDFGSIGAGLPMWRCVGCMHDVLRDQGHFASVRSLTLSTMKPTRTGWMFHYKVTLLTNTSRGA